MAKKKQSKEIFIDVLIVKCVACVSVWSKKANFTTLERRRRFSSGGDELLTVFLHVQHSLKGKLCHAKGFKQWADESHSTVRKNVLEQKKSSGGGMTRIPTADQIRKTHRVNICRKPHLLLPLFLRSFYPKPRSRLLQTPASALPSAPAWAARTSVAHCQAPDQRGRLRAAAHGKAGKRHQCRCSPNKMLRCFCCWWKSWLSWSSVSVHGGKLVLKI